MFSTERKNFKVFFKKFIFFVYYIKNGQPGNSRINGGSETARVQKLFEAEKAGVDGEDTVGLAAEKRTASDSLDEEIPRDLDKPVLKPKKYVRVPEIQITDTEKEKREKESREIEEMLGLRG